MKIDSTAGQSFDVQPITIDRGTKNTSGNLDDQASESIKQTSSNSTSKQDIYEYAKLNPDYRPTIAEKTVIDAIERANRKLMGIQAEFQFSIHEETKQIMVKVLNKETKEVVREIPPEKTLDMVARMWELAGIIVDEKR